MGLHYSIFPEGTQNGGEIKHREVPNFAAQKKCKIGGLNDG